MTILAGQRVLTVALIGNPNTGKSTLFTALAGVRQRTGNYPGVTVEKKIGQVQIGSQRLSLVDLPGTYSLAPRSPDEMVAVDVLLGRRGVGAAGPPDAVLCIVDASNLERNLYLVSQVLALGLPTVVALNMIDIARDRGLRIDVARLSERLGVPVVEVQANERRGVAELKQALMKTVESPAATIATPFPPAFNREVEALSPSVVDSTGSPLPRYLLERLLLDTSGYLEREVPTQQNGHLPNTLRDARARLAAAGLPVPAVEAVARYDWVARMLDGVVTRPRERAKTWTDAIDRVLTNRWWGTLAFAALMLAMFSAIFVVADVPMTWIDAVFSAVGNWIEAALPEGALRSLLTDGLVAGVGSVVVFLPQILILFLFIAILEDCGYMARAAYLMDKLMVRVGLSGKSFIPLLSSFACAIPGVMATRVIENRRDRLTTILVAPLMSCSARLPVYVLLIGAFIPERVYLGGWVRLQGLTLFSMYLIGIVTAVVVALVLKRTLLRGATPPFVMELPPYKIPGLTIVLHRMLDRGWAFVRRAGTLIVAVAIVVWAMLYYPQNREAVEQSLAERQVALEAEFGRANLTSARHAEIESQLSAYRDEAQREKLALGEAQRQSLLGRMGQTIEPAVRPLGWDWRIGSAVLASFPAREVVLGTLGVIYNLGEVEIDEEEGQTQLQAQLQSAKWDGSGAAVFNVPVALSLMVFFALCAQCAATLAVIKRETNSWRWPVFTFVYMTTLAYLAALATYQVGMHFV
ncbi:MAG: ferrous iron transport protein B [Pirellulales bacterium]